jgi:Fe-S-cluster containining protein
MSKVGSLKDMLSDEESGVKVFTKDGKCSGCGNCCANFLPISDVEIKRIRQYVKQHGIREQMRLYPTAKPIVDMQCPFRDETQRKCTIYPVRPGICRDFRCDEPEDAKINKALYHGKYSPVDMRAVFFGRENTLARLMEEMLYGNERTDR